MYLFVCHYNPATDHYVNQNTNIKSCCSFWMPTIQSSDKLYPALYQILMVFILYIIGIKRSFYLTIDGFVMILVNFGIGTPMWSPCSWIIHDWPWICQNHQITLYISCYMSSQNPPIKYHFLSMAIGHPTCYNA